MDYNKPVLDSLKSGPKRRQSLVNELAPIMSERKLEKVLKELKIEGRILKDSKASESRGGCETWYMLPRTQIPLRS